MPRDKCTLTAYLDQKRNDIRSHEHFRHPRRFHQQILVSIDPMDQPTEYDVFSCHESTRRKGNEEVFDDIDGATIRLVVQAVTSRYADCVA